MTFTINNLAASPCGTPKLDLDTFLAELAGMGFKKVELFTRWCVSAVDCHSDPALCVAQGRRHGLSFSSLHLPPIEENLDIAEAVAAARFAAAISAKVVIFKAVSRPVYIQSARAFLEATANLPVTPVLQNHFNTPISTIENYREVLAGTANPRMKTLLEVGHFEAAGIPWRNGYEFLRGSIALVHIKDMLSRRPVPFGTGEVNLPELFRTLAADGYAGDFVVEIETEPPAERLTRTREAFAYLQNHCLA